MKPIRVLLVDDQAMFREGIRTLLAARPELLVVGEAAHGGEALQLVPTTRPDVVLMDLRMPTMDGVEATRRLKAEHPHIHIIVLTTFADDKEVFAALRAGAVGYVLKASPAAKLSEAIQAAVRGESLLDTAVAAKLVSEFNRLAERHPASPARLAASVESLSPREIEVLRCLGEGASNKEIGRKLGITEGTVKNHLIQVFGKLGVLDRTQAALRARELGL